MFDIQEICNWIILFGAVTVGISNIYKFIKKPAEKIQEKTKKELDEAISKTFDTKMPKILEENNKKIKEELFVDIKSAVLDEVNKDLEEIRQQNNEQTESIKTLVVGSKDMLRQRIMAIYHIYKLKKVLPLFQREALDELYKDYKSENGNSYIDKYYKRMILWKVLDDDEESVEEK